MHYSQIQTQAFLRADLENLLQAIQLASEALVSHLDERDVQFYRLGFDTALKAVATALNVRLEPGSAVHESGQEKIAAWRDGYRPSARRNI